MKRSQASSPTQSSAPKHKKAKINPGVVQDASEASETGAGEWTKVEKRKQKKVKKTEVKQQDVCSVSSH